MDERECGPDDSIPPWISNDPLVQTTLRVMALEQLLVVKGLLDRTEIETMMRELQERLHEILELNQGVNFKAWRELRRQFLGDETSPPDDVP